MTADDVRNPRSSFSRSTSRSLLADARLADPEAWSRLVRLYAPLVASWCRRRGVAQQDVSDLLQEVFAAVAGRLNTFRKEQPGDTFRGWLATIAQNKVRDHFRRRAFEAAATGGTEAALRLQQIPDVLQAVDVPDLVEGAFGDELLRSALDLIRGEFRDPTWKAFWGTAVDGRSAIDVAADLNLSPGAVRVAKSRVLLRLRRELGDRSD